MTVNGESKPLASQISLQEYLEQNGYHQGRVAVERNGGIVPKTEFARTFLEDSDILEIVHFVGGG